MGVNLIFKIAAVGILVSVICQVLKHSGREDQAFLTSLAGLVLVLFWIVPYIYELFETIKNLFALPLIRDDRTDFFDFRITFFQPIRNRNSRFQKLFIADSNDPVVIRLLLVDIQFPFHIYRNQDHEHQRNGQSEDIYRRVPFIPAQEFQKRFYIQ